MIRAAPAALAALALAACGGARVGATSNLLDPLAAGDDPFPGAPGERCNLATFDEGESLILLSALRDAAVARVDGEPVRLVHRGASLRGGGTFRGDALEIEIGGIGAAQARAARRSSVPAVVAVRRGGEVETFEATWTC